MKIALIVPGGVDRSGTERVIPCLLWLIERLARETELHVFALNQERKPAQYALLGARVHNIGARPRRARAIAEILSEHRRGSFDVIHAVWAAPEGVVAGVVGRLINVPVVLGITGGDLADVPEIRYGKRRTARGRAWLRLAVANAARVTVPSAAMRTKAASLNIAAELVPLGIALDRWPVLTPRARQQHEPARLLHVASLNRVKDQRTLLLAVAELARSGLSFHLDVIGEDTLHGEVQALAAELGVLQLVTFHGFVRHANMRGFFERAHVLLVSSRHEADPIVMLEAAVAGVPTVGTAVGHIADWTGEASLAVPLGDYKALASETAALLADDARRIGIAAAAQCRALSTDADWSAQQYLKIYGELAGEFLAVPV
jgi:glycosyltransferase involved in cell wall biosynthesis